MRDFGQRKRSKKIVKRNTKEVYVMVTILKCTEYGIMNRPGEFLPVCSETSLD